MSLVQVIEQRLKNDILLQSFDLAAYEPDFAGSLLTGSLGHLRRLLAGDRHRPSLASPYGGVSSSE